MSDRLLYISCGASLFLSSLSLPVMHDRIHFSKLNLSLNHCMVILRQFLSIKFLLSSLNQTNKSRQRKQTKNCQKEGKHFRRSWNESSIHCGCYYFWKDNSQKENLPIIVNEMCVLDSLKKDYKKALKTKVAEVGFRIDGKQIGSLFDKISDIFRWKIFK